MKTLYTILLIGLLFFTSCGNSRNPETAKKNCLSDTTIQKLYGDKTTDYCNCISEKLQSVKDSSNLEDSTLEKLTQSCANEFTSLDTDF